MHVRIDPKPHEFIELDRSFFSRKVEIRVDHYWVPRGIWIECDQKLLDQLTYHIELAREAGDEAKVDRVTFLREQCSEHCRD